MNTLPLGGNANRSPLKMPAAKRLEDLEANAEKTCVTLAQSSEGYRSAKTEALENEYGRLFCALKDEFSQKISQPDTIAIDRQRGESTPIDPAETHFERMMATKREAFASEMKELQRQRQALQHLRQGELALASEVQGNLQSRSDLARDATDQPNIGTHRPGFIRRFILGRLFWDNA